MAPLVTIVVTTHNRPDRVGRAVDSALSQTVPDIEVIVVDDGSQPPCDLSGINDSRLRPIRHDKSRGTSHALNAGLEEAQGEWFMRLDDDDEYLPTAIETSLRAARSSTLPPGAVLTAVAHLDGARRVSHVDVHKRQESGAEYLTKHFFHPKGMALNTLLVKTDLLRQLGGYDEDLPAYEDIDLVVRLCELGSSITTSHEVTYLKPHHTGPRLTLSPGLMSKAADVLLAKHWVLLSRNRRTLASLLSRVGMDLLYAGHWGRAMRRTGKSLLYSPTRLKGIAAFLLALAGPRLYSKIRPFSLLLFRGRGRRDSPLRDVEG